jgi:hypothetical protein
MAYIQRGSDNEISAVSREPLPGFAEELPDDHPELQVFADGLGGNEELARSDLEFVRVLEDLLDVLMAKGVLMFTDLPLEAQAKVMERRALRGGEDALDLLDEESPI